VRERSGHLERVRRLHLPEKGKIVTILEGHRRITEAITSAAPSPAWKTCAGNIPTTSP